jgi:predicted acyl esterase
MKSRIHLTLTIAAAIVALWPAVRAFSAEPVLGDVREEHVMIPMRDGVRLSAYLYTPTKGEGPWPAIFEQRYAGLTANSSRESAARMAAGGYVVAMVNYRGTHLSEGRYVGYRALQWGELSDGHDVCEWLGTQSWSTGKVGTFGSSQGGYAQNYLAVTQPPHLVCQYMIDTGLSLFHEGYRIGGTTRPGRFGTMGKLCRTPGDGQALLEEWYQHPHYDDYWRDEDCTLHFDKMNVPCFTIGSWYDFMNQGSIASFVGREHHGGDNSRGKQWLLIGPWLHGRTNKGSKVGDMQYPDNATWPVEEHMLRWFDYWLKGQDNGVTKDPKVRYYVMGENQWRSADDWPPKIDDQRLFLQPEGKLAKSAPDNTEATTSFQSDPRKPMEIPGRSFPGARDARPFEEQSDVITYTTELFSEPVEWTGRVYADLHVSSTAKDTDFIVRISDVHPDGRSILIVDYPWRMRYRDGFDHEALMEPGKVYPLSFPIGWMSQVFGKSHRIRVSIASTGAPLYEPNPQTGEPLTIDFPDNAIKATNTIHHSIDFPSSVVLTKSRGR